MISEPRPPFDPNDKSYQEYVDEYYKFDCEDIIGDIPCRFKYRQVVPNSFGLTVEEILLAKDRELNRWCSLKKAVQYRPENQEKYDQIAYERKGRNVELKKKILTSLFEPGENEKDEVNNQQTKIKNVASIDSRKSKKKKKTNEVDIEENKVKVLIGSHSAVTNEETGSTTNAEINDHQAENDSTTPQKKKKKRKNGENWKTTEENKTEIVNRNNTEIKEEATNPKKKKKNSQDNETYDKVVADNETQNKSVSGPESKKKSRKSKNKQAAVSLPTSSENQVSSEKTNNHDNNRNKSLKNRKRKMNASNEDVAFKKQRRLNNKKKSDVDTGISDARLSAYGINAKKFKNKLKYGNKTK